MPIRHAALNLARVAWALQVVTAAPALEALFEDADRSVQLTGTTMAWVVWATALVPLLVPSTVSLTVLRVIAPAPAVVTIAALVAGAPGWSVGVAAAGAVTALGALGHAGLGRTMVQGSAYGDEARFPLRPPVLLLAGPIPATWAAAVGPVPVGALVLAAGHPIPGLALIAVGLPVAWVGGKALHRLSRRWLVFVPAGLVVHDQLALAETAMFRRVEVASVAAAEVGTGSRDATAGAAGLLVDIRLAQPRSVALATVRGRVAEPVDATGLLVAPSQPGHVVREAERRLRARGPLQAPG